MAAGSRGCGDRAPPPAETDRGLLFAELDFSLITKSATGPEGIA
jgi:hypothetical protein